MKYIVDNNYKMIEIILKEYNLIRGSSYHDISLNMDGTYWFDKGLVWAIHR